MINTKEQSVIKSIKDAFEGEDMQTQYSVLSYEIDLYFHKYKLAIEVDELGHADRNINNEIERQRALERDCMFLSCHVRVFRVNPHSIVAWMSRNSLLETGAKSEGEVTATGLETRTT